MNQNQDDDIFIGIFSFVCVFKKKKLWWIGVWYGVFFLFQMNRRKWWWLNSMLSIIISYHQTQRSFDSLIDRSQCSLFLLFVAVVRCWRFFLDFSLKQKTFTRFLDFLFLGESLFFSNHIMKQTNKQTKKLFVVVVVVIFKLSSSFQFKYSFFFVSFFSFRFWWLATAVGWLVGCWWWW